MFYSFCLYLSLVFCSERIYRINFKDDYRDYPISDKLYKYSNLLFDKKTVDLKDYDRRDFELVRGLVSGEKFKEEIILNELPSILKLISQLDLERERINYILKILYREIYQKSEFDYIIDKKAAVMLLRGFAEINLFCLGIKDTLAILNLPKRMKIFPPPLDNTRKLFLYGKTCEKFLKLDEKSLKLFSMLFRKAEFKELHFRNYLLTENLINKIDFLQDLTHLDIYSEKDKSLVLDNLRCLRFDRENLNEILFECIGSLKNLKSLKIKYNCNKAKLYENLIDLTNLVDLNIKTDEFSEDNLRTIFKLNSLENLKLNGKFPTENAGYFKTFDILNNLQSFTIENAGNALLKQFEFLDFFPIPNIRKLILPRVQLKKGFAEYLQYLEKLVELDLSFVNISNDDLNKIYELENLIKLTLMDIKNDNFLEMNSKHMKLLSLEELDISGNSLETEDIKILSLLPSLRILKARELRNLDIRFFDTGRFENLTYLDLRNNVLTFRSHPDISGYKMMETLYINYSKRSNLQGLNFLDYFLKFKYLRELSIDNLDINDFPTGIFREWNFKNKLRLSNPIGLEKGLKDLINIKSLTISNEEFSEKLNTLRKKSDLSEYNLTKIGNLKNLRSLNLNGLNLKKKYMDEISKLESIRTLKFYYCDFNFNDLNFLQKFKKLKHVIIYNCFGFDNEKEIIYKLPKVLVEISN